MTNQVPDDQRQLAISIMTTEQFTLQTARGVSTSESTSRATLFLSTLSSALVALGFVAQISRFGQSFSVFALLILPPIAFLGLITFQRAVQSGMEDEFYSQGTARIRQLYIELVPAIGPYFVQPTSMTIGSAVPVRPNHSSWQTFLTVGAAIGVVNSVVVGAIAGLAVNLIAVPPVGVSVGIGIAVTLGSVMLHYGYQLRTWPRVDEMLMTDSSARDPWDASPGFG